MPLMTSGRHRARTQVSIRLQRSAMLPQDNIFCRPCVSISRLSWCGHGCLHPCPGQRPSWPDTGLSIT